MSGIALRMAFELDLHRLGQNETSQRPHSVSADFSGSSHYDMERTWMVLYVTDRRQVFTTLSSMALLGTSSDVYAPCLTRSFSASDGRPRMVAKDDGLVRGVRKWAPASTSGVPVIDRSLAAMVDLHRVIVRAISPGSNPSAMIDRGDAF